MSAGSLQQVPTLHTWVYDHIFIVANDAQNWSQLKNLRQQVVIGLNVIPNKNPE